MASEVSRPLRRSTRRGVLNVYVTPRGPLKRTKKHVEVPVPPAAVNGYKDSDSSDNEDSPSKKSRVETKDTEGETEMDVQESDENMDKEDVEDQPEEEDPIHHPKICQGYFGDTILAPCVLPPEHHQTQPENKPVDFPPSIRADMSTKRASVHTKPASQARVLGRRQDDMPIPQNTWLGDPVAEYKKRMEAKVTSCGLHQMKMNHHPPKLHPTSEVSSLTRQHVNNNARQAKGAQHQKEGIKKSDPPKGRSGCFFRRFVWYCLYLLVLALFGSVSFLAVKNAPTVRRTLTGGGHQFSSVNTGLFTAQLSLLKDQFSSQRPEVWKMIRIHLGNYLQAVQPTEPVSLILTAGLRAERTLHCLAQGLATAFASALNSSVLHIDGTSYAGRDSDQVKFEVDNQLQAAFGGDKLVAIIQRFEELPPDSTLIFYRYCDHENAAYKRAFLLFTVLLRQDEVRLQKSVNDVEEMVQDYLTESLVDSGTQTTFKRMDANKFSGLWSRISHLVLPVASEEEVEERGC
ncbi:uncharacterized protein LOC117517914 [Thalassophryne amazonica]|uniref:uncharacterized protein LOC117517914 n=1 Tax=Thalassophryne amazonica TaxID=390379 RepID=UPI001470B3F4|nr:uncharacterized protein LOC117517914 [Thalassophryne amazonica]